MIRSPVRNPIRSPIRNAITPKLVLYDTFTEVNPSLGTDTFTEVNPLIGTDTFTDMDGTAISAHTSDTGNIVYSGTAVIYNNAVVNQGGAGESIAFTSNIKKSLSLDCLDITDRLQVMFRQVDGTNKFYVTRGIDGSVLLYEVLNNVYTVRASATIAFSAGEHWEVRDTGANISFLIDGVLQFEYSSTLHNTSGVTVINTVGVGTSIDNLSITDLTPVPIANHTSDSGGLVYTGTASISNNRVENPNPVMEYFEFDTGVVAKRITYSLPTLLSQAQMRFRIANSTNLWLVTAYTNGSLNLTEVTGGVWTGRGGTGVGAHSAGDIVTVADNGSVISIEVNGVEKYSYATTQHNTATLNRVQLWEGGSIDNLSITDITPVAITAHTPDVGLSPIGFVTTESLISGNELRTDVSGASFTRYAKPVPHVEWVMRIPSLGAHVIVRVRQLNGGDFFYVARTQTNIAITQVTGGVYTSRGGFNTPHVAGETIRVTDTGDRITIAIDGVGSVSYDSSLYNTAGEWWLHLHDAGTAVDNLIVRAL